MNKRLTISSARNLIKQELGLNASTLAEREDMNSSPEHPWFTLYSGTQRIDVFTTDAQQGKYTDKMIALEITHENSNKEATEYFYSDTLGYAAPYTEWKNREVFCEYMDYPEKDTQLQRLKREAIDDCREHFHGQPITQEISTVHSNGILEKFAFENFEGKILQGHTMLKIQTFDLHETYFSDTAPFDETKLNWWIKEVTQHVNNNPEKAAGFTVFEWDRENEIWSPYRPDGENSLTYDTGRRPDGIQKDLIQEITDDTNKQTSISERLSMAQNKSELYNHKENHKLNKTIER